MIPVESKTRDEQEQCEQFFSPTLPSQIPHFCFHFVKSVRGMNGLLVYYNMTVQWGQV